MGGSPKKPEARRQGRGTRDVGLVSRPDVQVDVPAADLSWREGTVERWVAFWLSPLARQVEQSDVGSLRRLHWLYDELDRMREAIEDTGRVVSGSQGQPRPNPLYKQMETFMSEARQIEDRFGLSPLSRLRLGITFADASASLTALNSRLSGKDVVPDDLWDDFAE